MSPLSTQVYLKESFRYAFYSETKEMVFVVCVCVCVYLRWGIALVARWLPKAPVRVWLAPFRGANRFLICDKDGEINGLFTGDGIHHASDVSPLVVEVPSRSWQVLWCRWWLSKPRCARALWTRWVPGVTQLPLLSLQCLSLAPLKGMQHSELGWNDTLGGCLLWAWIKRGCEAAVSYLLGEQIPPILNHPKCLGGYKSIFAPPATPRLWHSPLCVTDPHRGVDTIKVTL